ncbi:hypothetical protein HBI13_087460 [Parastagonospora nodorum]|nr:hypothetical protein HBI10_005750 [Parastagonospora nodorum]KAH4023405.1 hypothetical protein HBI13_087460 [Parastagonospora nodorum]KAH5458503.1 hypothetical protein HBI30_053960 [Parastagonospora nodorum]
MEAVWDAKQRVAKVQVCRRGSRAMEDAERIAAEADVAGLIVAGNWCGWYNLGNVKLQQWFPVRSLPAAVWLRNAQNGEGFR